MLSQQQRYAIDLALEGRNVFITGSGGVGKSFLIQRLIEELEARDRVVYVTASTGIAATNIGGTTVHAWAGIGTGTDPVEQLAARIKLRQKRVKARWSCDVLVIDEISMLDPGFFDTLNQLGKRVRARNAAFGGIQLVLCGDFFQLPPVRPKTVQFPFQTKAWLEANIERIELTKVFRQADQQFVSVLERVRWAKLDAEVVATLSSRLGAVLDCSDGIQPTHLYATNDRVDIVNEARLEQLSTEARTFRCRQTFSKLSSEERKRIGERVAKDCCAAAILTLKVGAQVMLLVNLDVKNGLSNGSRGVVIGFAEALSSGVSGFTAPIVRFTNGLELPIKYHAWRIKSPEGWTVLHEQVPLRLAWAWTIHKCVAGSTLIACENGLIRMESLFGEKQQQGESVETALKVHGQSELRVATALYKGYVEVGYRITTESGFRLEGSERHPILASKAELIDWYKLPDLAVGDLAALRFGTNAQRGAPRANELVSQEHCQQLARYTLGQECKLSQEFLEWAAPDKQALPWVVLQNNCQNQLAYLDALFADGPLTLEHSVCRQIQVLACNLGYLCRLNQQLEPPVLLGKGLIYEPIVSVEKTVEQQLYDFEIPEGHDFVGNGFVNHNSQGMTLDKVVLDLGNTFEPGQAYVALSRVRSLEGCSILNLDLNRIKASPVVCEYYSN